MQMNKYLLGFLLLILGILLLLAMSFPLLMIMTYDPFPFNDQYPHIISNTLTIFYNVYSILIVIAGAPTAIITCVGGITFAIITCVGGIIFFFSTKTGRNISKIGLYGLSLILGSEFTLILARHVDRLVNYESSMGLEKIILLPLAILLLLNFFLLRSVLKSKMIEK